MTTKIAIISALALMLASCGSTGEQDPKTSSAKETTTTASETVSISESVPEEEITIADSSEIMAETEAPETKQPIVTTEIHELDDSTTETKLILDVQKEEETVNVSVVKEMVGNDPQSYIDQILTEDGVISAELKDDGSVDVVFTKERYIKACEDMLQSSKGIIDNLLEKGDYTTITSITYNDDLSEIYVSLSDYNAYQNSMDSLFKWQLGATAGLYHKFLQDNATIMIHYLDQGGNEYASESLY
jgi:uncharacterized iron-regulated protein